MARKLHCRAENLRVGDRMLPSVSWDNTNCGVIASIRSTSHFIHITREGHAAGLPKSVRLERHQLVYIERGD